MLGRSHDIRTQAVKYLPARPHSAGCRVREEPRHTYTGGLPCRPDRTQQVAVSGRRHDTRTQAVKSLPARPHSAGCGVREEPRHTYTGGLPCRPDRTRQVAALGRSHDIRTQAVFPAGQTTLGRSLCQGGAATRSQAVKALPARPHSAGRRIREEP